MHAYTNIYRYISQEQIHLPDLPKHIYTYRACIYIYMYIYIHTYKYIHIGISIRFVGMHGCIYIYIYRIRRHATYVTIPMQIRIYFLSGHNNQEPGCDCFSFFLIPVERLTPWRSTWRFASGWQEARKSSTGRHMWSSWACIYIYMYINTYKDPRMSIYMYM